MTKEAVFGGEELWRTRLRSLVAASGMTRSEITKRAGLNPAYLTQILERKAATPRIDNLAALAAVLGTSVAFIADGVEFGPEVQEVITLFESMDAARQGSVLTILRQMASAPIPAAAA